MTGIDYHYVGQLFNPDRLRERVESVTALVRTLDFDSIAVRGSSGLIIGVPVALALGKPWGMVVKPGSHASIGYVGVHNPGRYIIIDDFICTGNTLRAILNDNTLDERRARCVGIVLYSAADPDNYFAGIPIYNVRNPEIDPHDP